MVISNTALLIAASAVGVFLLAFLIWTIILHKKVRRLLVGKDAKSLEDSIINLATTTDELKKFTYDMEQYLTTVETRVRKSVQAIETTRFNPFKGTGSGGNNSFSAAFLNEHGNGILLTSMYSRDRISMFAKPVKGFASDHDLSEEERETLEKCRANLQHQTP